MATEVVQAVVMTATISLIVAGILFYFFYRYKMARRIEKAKSESSFRRESVPRVEFRQHGGAVKGLIVDEEGLDVLYLRKLESGHLSGCFSKVWYNPMVEEVKRVNGRGEKPSMSEPIQEIPLLQQPRISHESHLEKTEFAASNLDVTLINQTSTTTPPPPPPPPLSAPPKLKPAPPPPPAKTRGGTTSQKPPVHPRGMENRHRTEDLAKGQMKLKPLHWDKVTANADHSMVWNEINDGSLRFDDNLMETLFGYTTTYQKSSHKTNKLTSSDAASSPRIFLLDPRKSQNTAIILKSLAISRKEIVDALLEGRGLNADTLEKLTKLSPTQEEITKIVKFSGNPTKLADAESFLYDILKAVPSAFVRFNAMLFRSTYDPEILHLKESLQTLELACKELRSGGIFFKLLKAILKAGNKMNAGTIRGNAQGFNLTALRRLSDVKSTDAKTTLLHFVVEQVIRSEGEKKVESIFNTKSSNEEKDREKLMLGLPVVESLSSHFANVKKAASIEHDSLISTRSILTTRVDEIKQMLNRESGGFMREMKGFLEDCQEELNVVREEEKRVMEIVRKTTVYYQAGDCKDKGGNPLMLFVIVKDFLNNVDQVCVEITKKLQKMKVGTSGGSSPPLSPTPRSPVRFQNLQMYFRAQRFDASSSDSDNGF